MATQEGTNSDQDEGGTQMATQAGTNSDQDEGGTQENPFQTHQQLTDTMKNIIFKSEYEALKYVRAKMGVNSFLRHKNFIFQRIDIALVLANCYQIRTIISEPNKHEYYKIPLGFAIASICLQVLFVIVMVISWQADRNPFDKEGNIKNAKSKIGKVTQFIAILLVLFIVIANIIVVEFGAMTSNHKGNKTD